MSVFRDVSLVVAKSECVGIFGPNGHGKTTLLKTIAGLLDPWSGDVIFDGAQLNDDRPTRSRTSTHINYNLFRRRRLLARHAVRAGLIYVMQGNVLFPEMTVQEVLHVAPLAAAGREGLKDMQELVGAIFPPVTARARSKIRHLSGGERQMISIAVGLLSVPRLLILDEPTLGLSPKPRNEVLHAVQTIKAEGVPLIVVDQNIAFLSALVDRLYTFDHGIIREELLVEMLPDRDHLITMLFGEGA